MDCAYWAAHHKNDNEQLELSWTGFHFFFRPLGVCRWGGAGVPGTWGTGGILLTTDKEAPLGNEGNRRRPILWVSFIAKGCLLQQQPALKQARLESHPCSILQLTLQPFPPSMPEGMTWKDGRCKLYCNGRVWTYPGQKDIPSNLHTCWMK